MDLKTGKTVFGRNQEDVKGEGKERPEPGKKSGILDLQAIGLPRLIIIVLAGIFLLILSIPQKKEGGTGRQKSAVEGTVLDEASGEVAQNAMEQYTARKEKQLEELLTKVDGVGKVQVMITLASSEEKITLQNDSATQESTVGNSTQQSQERQSMSVETVLIHRDGEEAPYLVQIISPEVEGVVVVAQGSDGSKVDTEIIAAVQALFSVDAHKIRVMRMK
ncbi:MAG: stage III sporulation protein AG [Lachnospiraceae bacterium]|nr:stage III sporulation protein AG [Lachnospiraceae bacterium]